MGIVPGEIIRASDFKMIGFKTETTSRASTTAVTADPDLVVPVAAGQIYVMDMVIHYDAAAAADLRVNWAGPAGTTYSLLFDGITTVGAALTDDFVRHHNEASPDTGSGGNGAGVMFTASARGMVAAGGTPGNFEFRWAQIISNATPTRVFARSYLRLQPTS